jgi:hypothetical protein
MGTLYAFIFHTAVLRPFTKRVFAILSEEMLRKDIPQTISDLEFTSLVRYYAKKRVERVYYLISGEKAPHFTEEYEKPLIPKLIANLINGIGVKSILNGSITFIPKPESYTKNNLPIEYMCAPDLRERFEEWSKTLSRHRVCRIGKLTDAPCGTAWWLMSVRSKEDYYEMADQIETTTVLCPFLESTAIDANHASIVQTGFNGDVGSIPTLRRTYEHIGLRSDNIRDLTLFS